MVAAIDSVEFRTGKAAGCLAWWGTFTEELLGPDALCARQRSARVRNPRESRSAIYSRNITYRPFRTTHTYGKCKGKQTEYGAVPSYGGLNKPS
jgi:hypothetical protein